MGIRAAAGVALITMGLILSGCSRRDTGAETRERNRTDSAAREAGRAAHRMADDADRAARKAGKELREAAREAREGWKEGGRGKPDKDK